MQKNGNPPKRSALFAPGEMIYTPAVLEALRAAGTSALALICDHMCGDWGWISPAQWEMNMQVAQGNSEEDIVSRHKFCDGTIEIVLITSYAHTPSLRWTEIILPEEVIPPAEYRGVQSQAGDEEAVEELVTAEAVPA